MLIAGLQKLTLIDFPDTVASIIFTQGCLFRCPYCHNPDLIFHDSEKLYLSEEKVLEYFSENRNMLDGVVITGGEPTLHNDLGNFLRCIKALGLLVKLDTNGVRPNMVRGFIREKLIDYVAMDIKQTWKKYNDIAMTKKQDDINNCRETMLILQEEGIPHEFRTTVLPGCHTEDDFLEIAGYLKPREQYFLQDIRYGKTLSKKLDTRKRINLGNVVSKIRNKYPDLQISLR